MLKKIIKKLPFVRNIVQRFQNYDKAIENYNQTFDILRAQIHYLENKLFEFRRYEQRKDLPLYLQKIVIKEIYMERTGKKLDLDHPKTFNEKIQWMKLYWNPEIKVRLTDKYLVREFVKERIGEKYLIKSLGAWDSFEDIDFEKLPDKFVLKTNHGCAMNLIVTDKSKLDYCEARRKFNNWLLDDFGLDSMEMHYSKIHRKIIAEEYIENFNGDVYDYKFWCFNGKVHYIQFLPNRKIQLHMAFFDREWNLMPFVSNPHRYTQEVPKPDNLQELIVIAEKLAHDFNYVRVDLYRLNDGSVKFGEMTFTPVSGYCLWDPPEWDEKMGNLFDLPVSD